MCGFCFELKHLVFHNLRHPYIPLHFEKLIFLPVPTSVAAYLTQWGKTVLETLRVSK